MFKIKSLGGPESLWLVGSYLAHNRNDGNGNGTWARWTAPHVPSPSPYPSDEGNVLSHRMGIVATASTRASRRRIAAA